MNICELGFDPALPPEVAKIMEKEVARLTEEDKAKLEAYWTSGVKLLHAISLDAGVYALAFSPDGNTLAASGEDGKVRLIATANGSIAKEFVPVPLTVPALTAAPP